MNRRDFFRLGAGAGRSSRGGAIAPMHASTAAAQPAASGKRLGERTRPRGLAVASIGGARVRFEPTTSSSARAREAGRSPRGSSRPATPWSCSKPAAIRSDHRLRPASPRQTRIPKTTTFQRSIRWRPKTTPSGGTSSFATTRTTRSSAAIASSSRTTTASRSTASGIRAPAPSAAAPRTTR